ncbi:hypothetical protein J6590_007107 [Homalodisca vitripennis]|nr:hypothetical protein J6590_007107 [Homalodisca vitripennis]
MLTTSAQVGALELWVLSMLIPTSAGESSLTRRCRTRAREHESVPVATRGPVLRSQLISQQWMTLRSRFNTGVSSPAHPSPHRRHRIISTQS